MNILVLSPHTDDAEIGCGGSMSKWAHEGHKIRLVVFSACEESVPEGFDKNITRDEFYTNINLLGIEGRILDYPVRNFPEHRQKILDYMIKTKNEFKPDLVVGTSLNDIHQDHKTVAEEMTRAFRECASIISYDMPYSTMNFNGNMYIKLEEKHIKNKHIMMNNYKSQVEKFPGYFDKECVYGSAQTHGMKVKTNHAESFEVIRWLIP